MSHLPVLLKEVIEVLDSKPGDFVIDGTVGSGGHAVEILKGISPEGKLLGVDWDESQIANCRLQIADYKNAIFVQGNYVELPEIIKKKLATGELAVSRNRADGLLLDLGFSSDQIENSG